MAKRCCIGSCTSFWAVASCSVRPYPLCKCFTQCSRPCQISLCQLWANFPRLPCFFAALLSLEISSLPVGAIKGLDCFPTWGNSHGGFLGSFPCSCLFLLFS